MPLNLLGSRVDSRGGEVVRDRFGRPISLDPELAEIIAPSDGRQIQAFQWCRLVCSRVNQGKKVWLTGGFSTTISSDLKPGPLSKQPSTQHTANQYSTAGYCSSQ